MYNVSNEYLEKIQSVSREVAWYGSVTLTNGTVYNFTPSDLKQGQTSVTKQLCSNRKLEIGCTCSAELKIAFMLDYDGETYTLNGISVDKYEFYDAEISLYFRLYLDEGYEDVKIGTFIVSEPERSTTTLICTAYDYMQKFSKACVSTIQSTPYNVLLSACSVCEVELGNSLRDITSMANGRNTCAMYDPNNLVKTWRDVIGYVASMLGGNAVIKPDNKLYIIPYNTNVTRTLSADNRVSLTLADYISNYNILTAVNSRMNVEEKVKVSDEGLTYALGTNPLIQYITTNERQTTYENILSVLSQIDYVPFNGTFYTDPSIELGDVLLFTDNHASTGTKSIVTSLTINVNGHMELSCDGENPYAQKIEENTPEYNRETAGSVGDGVTFYDFINTNSISIPSQTETEIVSISYDSNGAYRHEFAAEVKLTVATSETEANNIYTENDCALTVKYYINGQAESYQPQYTYTDGTYLLHLLYIWESDIRVDSSTFKANIILNGGSASISGNNIHARIMQSGEAYVAPSNDLLYIEVTQMPTKTSYNPGETIDYSGLVVSAFYEDGHAENITSQCTLTPTNGTQITELRDIIVDVDYTKDDIQYYTSFDLEVVYLLFLDVVNEPSKTEYYVGDSINLSGLLINAEYSNDSSYNVTSLCSYEPSDGSLIETSGNIIITATYTENGVTETCEIYLYAETPTPEELIITNEPNRTNFVDGEELDLEGIEITCLYSNGDRKDVTEYCSFTPEEGYVLSPNDESVEITYDSISTSLEIEVHEIKDLKYFIYTIDHEEREIYISGLNVEEIISDGVTELSIPKEYNVADVKYKIYVN